MVRSHQDSKGTPCCCMCSDSSRCVHCISFKSGVMCSSCLPLKCGHCSYLSPEIDCPGSSSQKSSRNNNGLNDVADVSNSVTTLQLFNERFQCAFDALLLHSEGNCYDDTWCKLCLQLLLRTLITTCQMVLLVEILLLGCLYK